MGLSYACPNSQVWWLHFLIKDESWPHLSRLPVYYPREPKTFETMQKDLSNMSVCFFSRVSSLHFPPPYTVSVLLLFATNCSHFPERTLLSYRPPGLLYIELYSDVFLPTLHLGRSQAIIKSCKKAFPHFIFLENIYKHTYILYIHMYVYTYMHIEMHISIWILWHIYVLLMLRPFVFSNVT